MADGVTNDLEHALLLIDLLSLAVGAPLATMLNGPTNDPPTWESVYTHEDLEEGVPLFVIASFLCREGDEARTEQLLSGHVAPTRQEPGCEHYALHRVAGEPQRWVLVERWASKEPCASTFVAST
jgi:Antibiotic biosynthesis monooxygenase